MDNASRHLARVIYILQEKKIVSKLFENFSLVSNVNKQIEITVRNNTIAAIKTGIVNADNLPECCIYNSNPYYQAKSYSFNRPNNVSLYSLLSLKKIGEL